MNVALSRAWAGQRWLALVLALSVSLPWAVSGEESTLEPGYVHRHWTTEDGLPVNALSGVAQDEDGYLWIGSYDGLIRFDGHRFTVLRPDEVPEIDSPRIREIAWTPSGLLVLTSTGGLARYHGGRFHEVPDLEPADGRVRFLERQGGDLWVVTEHALFRVDGDGRLDRVARLPVDRDLTGLVHDQDGFRWLTTSQGVVRFEGDEPHWHETSSRILGAVRAGGRLLFFRQNDVPLELEGGRFRPFHEEMPGARLFDTASVGQLPWGGSLVINGGRYFRTDGEGLRPLGVEARALALKVSFAAVAEGRRWLAVGSKLYRDGELVFELAADSDLQSLCVDREGTIWLATSDDGLHALVPSAVAVLGGAQGLVQENVYAVYEDRSGQVWVGTHGGGAWRYGDGGLTAVQTENPALPTFPRAFLEDDEGEVWVGLSGRMSGGIQRMNGERLAPIVGDFGDVPSGAVNALLQDRQGRLWAGTSQGLYQRERGGARSASWRRIGADELPHPEVRSLALSPEGRLWVATGGGLARLGEGGWRRIDKSTGLPSNLVRALFFDSEGVLWVGTEDGGLARLDPASREQLGEGRIVNYGTAEGIHSNGIHHILEDGFGHLWMSSNQGLFRVRREELEALAAGRARRVESVAYTEQDGLPNREANGGSRNAGMRSRDGRLWFATQGGVVVVEPAKLFENVDSAPALKLERLRAKDRIWRFVGTPEDATIVLPAGARTFSVEYALASLREAHRARFRYRLEGYEGGWTDAAERRQAFFTRVPAGTYTFRVEALGLSTTPLAVSATARLTIQPYVYETWWFRILAALIVLGALGVVFQLRNARHRARERELERRVDERTAVIAEQAEKLRELDRLKSELFTDVSHELRTPLTLAMGPLQDLLSGARGDLSPEVQADVGLALRNARRILDLINQILEVARLEAAQVDLRVCPGELVSFLVRRLEGFRPFGERAGIESAFEAAGERQEAFFDPEQLAKVIDNLLANAFNLTPRGGKVVVALTADDPAWLRISVRDTGPGIPAEALDRIFLRFQREDGQNEAASRRDLPRRWPGTGIGLAQAKAIAELHHGTIQAESAPGEGATFVVSLRAGREHFSPSELVEEGGALEPAAVESVAQSTLEPLAEVDEEHLSGDPAEDRAAVLVVDDSSEIRRYVRRGLAADYRVLEAVDGREALDLAAEHLPDLIISDVMMPNLDGFELARSLAADPALDFIPMIFLTAKGSMESKLEGLGLGIDDYLTKPFDSRELLSRVRNLIEGRRRLLEHVHLQSGLTLETPPVEVEPADQHFVRRVGELVDQHMADADFGVEALASALGCDRSYLFRRLRELLGETPSAILRRLRLERAEQLLRGRAGQVGEIAYRVGFRSVSHFSQCFRERYGSTPSSYLSEARANGSS